MAIIAYATGEGGEGFRPFDAESESDLPKDWLIYFCDDGRVFDKILLRHGLDGWRRVDPTQLRRWISDAALARWVRSGKN